MTSPDPAATTSITFAAIEFRITGPQGAVGPAPKPDFTLHECGQCAALVRREKVEQHASWHATLRQDTKLASLGFGNLFG